MIRFPTEAANADVLGDDTPLAPEPPGASAPRQRGRPERPEHRRGRRGGEPGDAGTPGRDINAPGFIKDEGPRRPS